MKIRLYGTPAEVEGAVELLREVFTVHSASRPYASRNASRESEVRVYVTASLPASRGPDPDPTAPRCPWCALPYTLDGLGFVEGGMAWTCRRCDRMYAAFAGLIAESRKLPVEQVRAGDWVFVMAGFRRVLADPTEAGGLVTVAVATSPPDPAVRTYEPGHLLSVIRPSSAVLREDVTR